MSRIRDPFATRSPYAELEQMRQQRLVIAVSTWILLFTLAPVVLVGMMLITEFSTQTLFALILAAVIAPIGLLTRGLAKRGKTDLAGYLLLSSLLIIVALNGLLIEGLAPIQIPGFILLIVLAGMIMGPRMSYIIAGAATLLFLAAQLVTERELFTGAMMPAPLAQTSVIVVIILAFVFVAVMSQLATRDLRRALDDATYNLVQANHRLEEASELKSQFTAHTSHELRTPLSAIIAFTDLALRDSYGPLTPKLREPMQHVFESAQHLNTLINDVLDLSKIEAGQLEMFVEPFHIAELVQSVEANNAAAANEKGLDFSVYIDPSMPLVIEGDKSRIAQVVLNLTNNAIKFTDQGSVAVHIQPIGNAEWRILVRDTGHGIPEDKFDAIFESYRQLGIRGERGGTGLGLAITKHLVEMMNGKLLVDSVIGRGTAFTVLLPLSAVEPSDLARVEQQPAAAKTS